MISLSDKLSTEDKAFVEALLGETKGKSIQVLHSTRGIIFAPDCDGLYHSPDLLYETEQLKLNPILCDRLGGPESRPAVQRSFWVSLSHEEYDYRAIMDALGDLPCPPSAIVDTGSEIEGSWLLSESLTTNHEISQAEWAMRWLTTSILGKSWADDSLRGGLHFSKEFLSIPGTTNLDLDVPKTIDLIESNLHRRYTLFDLVDMTLTMSSRHYPESAQHLDPHSVWKPRWDRETREYFDHL